MRTSEETLQRTIKHNQNMGSIDQNIGSMQEIHLSLYPSRSTDNQETTNYFCDENLDIHEQPTNNQEYEDLPQGNLNIKNHKGENYVNRLAKILVRIL